MSLTRAGIVQHLKETLGLSGKEAQGIVDAFYEKIATTLKAGEEVRISGFGNFELRDKSARPGRNPKTGEEVEISSRRVVVFRTGPKLRAKMNILSDK